MPNSLQETWPDPAAEEAGEARVRLEEAAPAVREGTQAAGMQAAPWGLAKKLLLRLGFLYFVLYMAQFVLLATTTSETLGDLTEVVWRSWVPQAGKALFHVQASTEPSGSGDTTYDFLKLLAWLVLAAVGGTLWALRDRRKANDERVYAWFLVWLRFSLASAMILYGASKVFMGQFSPPGLGRLIETYGDSSPMGLLWTFMGFSQGYTRFAGLGEMLGGVLMITRRTSLLGAMVSAGVLTNVVLLNFFYDVPVKQFSSHLLLMALLIMAPHARRLANLLIFNRTAEPAPLQALFRRPLPHRTALVLRTLFIVGLSAMWLYKVRSDAEEYGLTGRKPPLYGVWDVDAFELGGTVRPPLLTDAVRWRRLVFEYPQLATLIHMEQPRQYFGLQLNEKKKTMKLTDFKEKKLAASLSYRQPKPDVLVLDGTLDGQTFHAQLHRSDQKFLLTSRGFHWVSEQPFNR